MFEWSGMAAESVSYTMMREAVCQRVKRDLAVDEGSMAASLSRENMGRLSRVDGTDSDKARGNLAFAYAAWGRMSTTRVVGLSSH